MKSSETAALASSPRSISPRRAASWVAMTGDFRAAIRPSTVAKSALGASAFEPLGATR